MDLQPYNARLEKFFSEVAVLQRYQRLTANISKQMITDLQTRETELFTLDAKFQEVLGTSVQQYTFYNPYTGVILPYSHIKLTLKETARLVHLHKNKQYQWLLVEAYELFEDYVVSLYDFIRTGSGEFRLSVDANATLPTVVLKRKVPQIIDMLRKKLPEVARMEVQNKTDTNLRLHYCMAEKFRHIIVHRNGKTSDPTLMTDEILKRANLAGDKAREPTARATIASYVGVDEVAGVIVLVEKPVFCAGGLSIAINRQEDLVNSLMAHAMVMSQSVVNHVGSRGQSVG